MRRRFRQNSETGELVEIAINTPDNRPIGNTDRYLWSDAHYDGLKATDGTDISSRKAHRAYMKANNLTTLDDYQGKWKAEREKRDAYFTEGKGGATRKEDVARAIAQLERMRPNHRR